MKRTLIGAICLFLLVFLLGSDLFGRSSKLAVAGFLNLGDKKDDNLNLVMSKSMYNFLQKLPGLELVPLDQLQDAAKEMSLWDKKTFSSDSVLNLGMQFKADTVIYGDYRINNRTETVLINLYSYDVKTGEMQFRRKYEGDSGADIFDTIDSMIQVTASLLLGRPIALAKITLGVFNTEQDYQLFIGGKFQKIVNRKEGYSDNILANELTPVSLKKPDTSIEVYRKDLLLKKDENFNFNYEPSGAALIKARPESNFQILLDGTVSVKLNADGETLVLNLPVNKTHKLAPVYSGQTNNSFVFDVKEGTTTVLEMQNNHFSVSMANAPTYSAETNRTVVMEQPVQKNNTEQKNNSVIPDNNRRTFYFPVRLLNGGLGMTAGAEYLPFGSFKISAQAGAVFPLTTNNFVVFSAELSAGWSFGLPLELQLCPNIGAYYFFSNPWILSPMVKVELAWHSFFIEVGARYSLGDGNIYPVGDIGYRF